MDAYETKVFIAILIAVFILSILLIFFISTLLRHQRKNAELYEQQLKAVITTLEAERKRVASDLHDDLGPFLASIKLQVNLLNTQDEEDISAIKEISNHLDGIIEKVRETSNNLMPNVLIRKGLIVAINSFAQRINKTNVLAINTFLDESLELEEEKEVHVYRIFQEGVHNTLRHANATQFEIKLERKEAALHMVMSDNGKGFDFETMSNESIGFGLKSISNRVDLLKGDFYLDSKPGRGAKYTIVIPL